MSEQAANERTSVAGAGAAAARSSEGARLAELMHRAHFGGAWHGPALGELLASVSAEEARARPLPEAHTIWEIALHATAWLDIVRRRAAGEGATEVPAELDWPPVRGGAAEWKATRQRLARATEKLRETIAGLSPQQLAAPVAGTGDTVIETLYGVLQHTLYHAGQVGILRKAAARAVATGAGSRS